MVSGLGVHMKEFAQYGINVYKRKAHTTDVTAQNAISLAHRQDP